MSRRPPATCSPCSSRSFDLVPIEWDLLVKDVPQESAQDLDYIVDMVDWDLNTDPDFFQHRFMAPRPVAPMAEMETEGLVDKWVAYRSPAFSAKETTILPGRTVKLVDAACYGLILLQGHGTLGSFECESPTMIRFGQLTSDEFFVTEERAKAGVTITNPSETDPIVMLRHYGAGKPGPHAVDARHDRRYMRTAPDRLQSIGGRCVPGDVILQSQAWVESVAQPVAQQVEAEYGKHDRQPREEQRCAAP